MGAIIYFLLADKMNLLFSESDAAKYLFIMRRRAIHTDAATGLGYLRAGSALHARRLVSADPLVTG